MGATAEMLDEADFAAWADKMAEDLRAGLR
jgi:hypothetical protein